MRKLVSDLLSIMKRKEFETTLINCLTWLENARHSVPIPMSQFGKYNGSYLASENLTYYVCESEHTFKVKLYIPDVYDFLVDALKSSSITESGILTIPAVRGYVFEKKFLSSMKLRETSLTVLAVNCQTSGSGRGPLEFDFPALTPCDNQLMGPLKTKLEECQVYHLRQRHPAIDAVVFIEEYSV